MVTAEQLDLALLCDDEGNSVRITVLGPLQGVAGGLAAEIVVGTPFVAGRVALSLWRSRLTSWAEALDRLAARPARAVPLHPPERRAWLPRGGR